MNLALQRAAIDPRIGRRHRLRSVLLYLAARAPNDDGWIEVKHASIARALGTDRTCICIDLQHLVELEYLAVRPDGHSRSCQYRFVEAVRCGVTPLSQSA